MAGFSAGIVTFTVPLGGNVPVNEGVPATVADPSFGASVTESRTAAFPYATVMVPIDGETPVAPGGGFTKWACGSENASAGQIGAGEVDVAPPPEHPASSAAASHAKAILRLTFRTLASRLARDLSEDRTTPAR